MNHLVEKGLMGAMLLLGMYFYYIYYPIHGQSKEYFLVFMICMIFLYGIYKGLQILISLKNISFNFIHVFGVLIFQVIFVSCFFFGISSGIPLFSGFGLAVKILFLLVLISSLWLIIYSFGKKIVYSFKAKLPVENIAVLNLISLGLGFSAFIFGCFLFTAFGLYNITVVGTWILLMGIISWKELYGVLKQVKRPLVRYQNIDHPHTSLRLILDELQFIVITFLLSVNLVSVFRPFPIGWDDLGVYMNWPKLLSGAGELLPLGQMYFWQLYTGIGFLAGSQTFAFFLNTFSGIVVALVVYTGIHSFIKKDSEKPFDFGLTCVLMILMMPMTIFQLAKDMKVDYGLLFMSIIVVISVYHVLFTAKHFSHKKSYLILGVIGFLIGICFSIKLTSLLLLLSVLSLLFYKKFSLLGFTGFIFLFVGIFTFGNLWSLMNVVSPEFSSFGKTLFLLISLVLGGGILSIANYYKHKGVAPLKHLFTESGIIVLGFIIGLSPWIVKHTGEISKSSEPISVKKIITGVSDNFNPNYESIYSREALDEVEVVYARGITQSGTTTNEDFGRYFGYEKGINNYLKLPWNLTFQVNQRGEFTDITFIFFVLIPLIFIFLPYKKQEYKWGVVGFLVLLLLYYIPGPISHGITQLFSFIQLPTGYFIILGAFLLPLIYFYYTLDRKNTYTQLFLGNYAFGTLYVFLWAISAFGIVWYGIVMYFVFILMIFITLLSLLEQDKKKFYFASYIVLLTVGLYVIISAIPHSITNLRTAGYHEYKLGLQSEEGAIMQLHPDYFPILWELNIRDEVKQELYITHRDKLLSIADKIPELANVRNLVLQNPDILTLHSILGQLNSTDLGELSFEAQQSYQDLNEAVIYPEDEYKNKSNIYRVGTFMKYFISDNNSRVWEDSLLNKFDTYVHDENNLITKERLEQLDISYLLFDLNAATIDNDVRKALTGRYEHMLEFTLTEGLELIETDSICLRLGRDLYDKNGNIDEYMTIAGSNYDSISQSRVQKRTKCAEEIIRIIQTEVIDFENYSYLQAYTQLLAQSGINIDDTNAVAQTIANRIPIGYKALFKIQ